MSILFINACVRENSRTQTLAKHVMKDMSDEVIEVDLNAADIAPLDRKVKGGKKFRNEAYAERSLAIMAEVSGNLIKL